MRPPTLVLLILVTACPLSENKRGRTAEDESHPRREAGQPEREYVPKPKAESDDRPWASAFANSTLETAGVRGTRDERALSWLGWGVPLDRPAVGAVAVLDFGQGRGHVAFVEGTYKGKVVLLGGDQSNEVNSTAFAADDIKAYRWPAERPVDESAYDFPIVRPTGAPDDGRSAPGAAETNTAGAPVDADATGSTGYRSLDGEQTLRVEPLGDNRIRFHLQKCERSVTGTAYEIYPGDAQIDAEQGIGYPAREYFYWGDSEGKRGLSIRVSIKGPRRARTIEWGYQTQCPYSDAVMHGTAAARR